MLCHENSISLRLFDTCSCNSDNNVQTVIIIGSTRNLWRDHVLHVFLHWIEHYKQCVAMKTLSIVAFSVFAYLSQLSWLDWENSFWRKISTTWVVFIETTCVISTFALILLVKLMFSHENSVSLRFLNTCSLKCIISSNSDNSAQTVIIIVNSSSLWQNHVLNVILRWIYHCKHCFAMKTLSILVCLVFAYLVPLGRLQWNKHCCRRISRKWVRFIASTCFIRTVALILVAY